MLKFTLLKISRINVLVLLIFMLAMFLRLLGTNPGYYITHPDEPTITDLAKSIALTFNFEPHAYYYGSLLSILYGLTDMLFLLPPTFVIFASENRHIFGSKIAFFLDPLMTLSRIKPAWLDFLNSGHYFDYWTRYETAVLSSFTVIVAYSLGKKLFSKEIGLVTAFFIAVNYRHVLSGNFSLADAPAAFFVLLSIYLSSQLLTKLTWNAYFWAGIGLGLIFSVKYFIYSVPSFLLCHVFGTLNQNPNLKNLVILRKIAINPKLFFSLLLAIGFFSMINIYIFLKPQDALFQLEYNATKYALPRTFDAIVDISRINYYSIYYLYKFGLGEILFVMTIIGFFYGLFKYTKSLLILLVTIIPFLYLFIVLTQTTHGRYFSPIIPLVLFLPSILTVSLAQKICLLLRKVGIRFPTSIGILAIMIIVGYQSIHNSYSSSYYFSKPYNSNELQEWVLKNMPDGSNYFYYWAIPTPPGYKKINSTFIHIGSDETKSLDELHQLKADYIAVGSDVNGTTNGLYWMNNNQVIKKVFFNENYLWEFLGDSYPSLVTQELGYYRVEEFAKPFWQALDPSFFIAKYPKFWGAEKDKLITSYNFSNPSILVKWKMFSYNPDSFYKYSLTSDTGLNNSPAIMIAPSSNKYCKIPFTKISSNSFRIEPQKWYILSGWGKRTVNLQYKNSKNGFIRLDFYSKDSELLKTYVSKQLTAQNGFQKLKAAGFSTHDSVYGKITIQLNNCQDEQYVFDNLEIHSGKVAAVDKVIYPYFDQKLSKSFIWLPHL